MFIFAGLGNPGRKYEWTRHNVGFLCIDYVSLLYNIPVRKLKFKALIGEGTIEGEKVLLVKPQTYMNNSGESIKEIVDYYGLSTDRLVVIYNDIDLDLGTIRIRPRGSAGTHNGMRSILYHLESEDFPRIRIGIGKPESGQDLVSFVLGRLNDEEQEIMAETIKRAGMAVREIIVSGVEAAMSRYNGKINK